MRASSPYKFLRFIVGRHDLPFYYPHSARLQLSFLDAFLKDNDCDGRKSGQQPRVHICVRKGDCVVDDPERKLKFPSRAEVDWPIPDAQYTKFFLTPKQTLSQTPDMSVGTCTYDALNGPHPVTPHRFLLPSKARLTSAVRYRPIRHRAIFEPFKRGNAPAFFEHIADDVGWQVKGRRRTLQAFTCPATLTVGGKTTAIGTFCPIAGHYRSKAEFHNWTKPLSSINLGQPVEAAD
ncbi:hypothetical protein GB937_009653 [Aspergillus fischeri]|nr:hypothetical protein GB937_009653 [Aspergillus fischeri]